MGSVDAVKAAEMPETNETNETTIDADPHLPVASTTPDTARDVEWEYITGIKLLLVNMAVLVIAFIMLLDNAILATAIPQITNQFHSLPDIGWYGSAYLMSSCACGPTAGKLYNRFSSKYTFIVFVAIFEFGSLICAVAVSSNMLIVGRAVAGIGGSGILNGGLIIISACVPLEKRAAYLGFMMSFSQLGMLLGPVLGGILTEYVSWRWCFYINLPIGGIGICFISFLNIPERRKRTQDDISFLATLKSLDPVGFILFAPTTIQFLLALEWGGNEYGWNSTTIIGLFCGSASTLVVFFLWEYRIGDKAMIPWYMVRIRVVWMCCANSFFVFSNMLTTSYYIPIYFQAIKGESPTISSVHFLPTILSLMLFSVTSGILVDRIGYYLPFAVFSAALVAISSGLLSTLGPASTVGAWIGYQIVGGIGRGSGIQMPIIAIQNVIKPEQIPIGMALVAFSQNFGGALFLTFDQIVFSTRLKEGLKKHAPEIDSVTIITAGASGFRKIVSKASLPGVIDAYSGAFSYVFYLAAGTATTAFCFAWGIGWRSIKKPRINASET